MTDEQKIQEAAERYVGKCWNSDSLQGIFKAGAEFALKLAAEKRNAPKGWMEMHEADVRLNNQLQFRIKELEKERDELHRSLDIADENLKVRFNEQLRVAVINDDLHAKLKLATDALEPFAKALSWVKTESLEISDTMWCPNFRAFAFSDARKAFEQIRQAEGK